MRNVAIFASGNGSNFQALLDANLECNICLLVCDNKSAYVLKRAKDHGIATLCFNPKDYVSKADYEEVIIKELEKFNVDLLLLAGYMRILSKNFIDKYHKNIINIHPSHLPKYRGINAIKQAVDAGEGKIGVTIHHVDYGIDTGEVIACELISINPHDPLESIEESVHQLEHKLYPKVIKEVIL